MGIFNWPKRSYVVGLLCATSAIALRAQTITTLHSFNSADGANPFAGLVQGSDGNFYGTTRYAGANNAICTAPMSSPGCGTVFQITATGSFTTLHNFCSQSNCADGQAPNAGLVQGSNGNFYGTTVAGGAFGGGTVFEITPGGTLITLYSFCAQTNCTDGQGPAAALILASDQNFYGTTSGGGTNGFGTVFQIAQVGGPPTTLHSFTNTEGFEPTAPLVQGSDGNLYGTTSNNGVSGTIFKISPAGGPLTILYSFCSQANCTDGKGPSGLVQGSDGNFYGTTSGGGANASCGTNFQPCGTVFKIAPTVGPPITLHSFNTTDGFEPTAGLVQGSDGNFYGTTFGFPGTIFRITPAGALTTLYTFCAQTGCTDGDVPIAGLIQGTDGDFYGTTELGGTGGACNGCGTVFSLQVPLPTVIPSPTSLDFGNQPITTTSGVQPITVNNSGSPALLIRGITPSGDFAETSNCPISPNTLSSGAACTINVTFTPSVTGSRTGAITIRDNAADSPQTVTLAGNGTDFSLSASPSTQTVGAGKSATYTLSVAPISGYTGAVALGCSGVPPAGSCTISPTSVSLSGTTTVTAAVTIATAGMGKKGTPKGTYKLTLTGSFSTLSHTTQVALTVK